MPAIVADGIVKTYGRIRALDGVDLEVKEGTVLGVLGPNGAGKTTTVRVLTTLLRPDAGYAEVAGIDVLKRPDEVRRAIGLSGQYAAVDEYLTGRENLVMYGQLYGMSKREARKRADELLEQFALTDAADRPARTYSGGMRRRLDLAGALVAKPAVLFLDEPTTGLDPRSRIGMWDVINELVKSGTTLLLTTQYLEEADQLADEIVVVDHGRIIARGTADELKTQVGGEQLSIVVATNDQLGTAVAVLRAVGRGEPIVDTHARRVTVAANGVPALSEAVRRLDAQAIEVLDIGLSRPSLDDVFLALTGHKAEEDETEEASR
ncbi:MAG TPA: ATP-binding cassette domain-containing protein [Acidimicrobiales bacterium]